MATEQASPTDIRKACTRLEEAARGNPYLSPMNFERDIFTVMMAARSHAEMLDRLTPEPADSLIPPMTFMGIVVQINPALPPGCCQIIGPEGKLLASFQV